MKECAFEKVKKLICYLLTKMNVRFHWAQTKIPWFSLFLISVISYCSILFNDYFLRRNMVCLETFVEEWNRKKEFAKHIKGKCTHHKRKMQHIEPSSHKKPSWPTTVISSLIVQNEVCLFSTFAFEKVLFASSWQSFLTCNVRYVDPGGMSTTFSY